MGTVDEIISDFFFFEEYVFIYFWLCWVSVAVLGLSPVAVSRGYSSFRTTGFRIAANRFSGCGARAGLLHGMWNLPGPGIEPMSPALAGGFLSTVPPGKSSAQKLIPSPAPLPSLEVGEWAM